MDRDEMEALMREAIGNGNMLPDRIYDVGLQYVIPRQAGGGVEFEWFYHIHDISDHLGV